MDWKCLLHPFNSQVHKMAAYKYIYNCGTVPYGSIAAAFSHSNMMLTRG